MNKFLISILLICLAGCSDRSSKLEEALAESAENATPEPTIEEAVIAVLRAHPNSLKVCYDSRYQGYFVSYKPLEPEEKWDSRLNGWYHLTGVRLYRAANNTWYTGLQEDKKYVTVYPDVTGLPCKERGDVK